MQWCFYYIGFSYNKQYKVSCRKIIMRWNRIIIRDFFPIWSVYLQISAHKLTSLVCFVQDVNPRMTSSNCEVRVKSASAAGLQKSPWGSVRNACSLQCCTWFIPKSILVIAITIKPPPPPIITVSVSSDLYLKYLQKFPVELFMMLALRVIWSTFSN